MLKRQSQALKRQIQARNRQIQALNRQIQMLKRQNQRLLQLLPLSPEEIIFKILLKLPVKFKCVCKNWNQIIHSQNFKLNYSVSSPPKCIFLYWLENSSQIEMCTTLWDNPFSVLSTMQVSSCCDDPFCNLVCWIQDQNVIGSCNGLLCISNPDCEHDMLELFLWNPSIRKHKILPKSSFEFHNPQKIIGGMGFDSNIGDYKILRIACAKRDLEAEIYSLKLDSWRSVKIPSNINNIFFGVYTERYAYVNGALHWLVEFIDEYEKCYVSILRFDVSTEKFDEIELPYNCEGDMVLPFDFNGLLAILVEPYHKCYIWMMMEGLWSIQIVKPAIQKLLWHWFACVKDQLVAVKKDDNRVFLIHPQTQQEIVIDIEMVDPINNLISVCEFRENLVLL